MKDTKTEPSEPSILAVEGSYRIRLPQVLLSSVHWIIGKEPLNAWLLLGSSDRCKLLASSEVETDPMLQALRTQIRSAGETSQSGILDFRNAESMAMPIRLSPVRITPPQPGWRLTIPRAIAATMRLKAGESEIAAFLIDDHIEFWTIDMLRQSVNIALTELI